MGKTQCTICNSRNRRGASLSDSVVIIGAGINGLVAANYLRRAGCDVTVIDRATYTEPDLATMQLVRQAFDPTNIANPDKIFPRPRLCGEKPGPHVPHPLEVAGIAEYF